MEVKYAYYLNNELYSKTEKVYVSDICYTRNGYNL
jgi:hypothetical protein